MANPSPIQPDNDERGPADLPDRVEDLPAWREPPRAPEIPEVLKQAVPRPASVTRDDAQTKTDMSDTAKAFGIALDFVATVMVGAFLGWGLGKWLGHMPSFVLGGIALGMVAAFVRVVRGTQATERREAAARQQMADSQRP